LWGSCGVTVAGKEEAMQVVALMLIFFLLFFRDFEEWTRVFGFEAERYKIIAECERGSVG